MDSCSTIRKCAKNPPGDCPPSRKPLKNLDDIVQDYIDNHRKCAKEGLNHFANQPDLSTAIRFAALAINKKGKRHSHQRRIPFDMLEHFRQGLLRRQEALRSCKNFPELMKISEKVAAQLWENPGLTAYDATHRIGAYLDVHPDRVYLHTGTREGAKALGFNGNLPFILPSEFPKEFQKLEPHEIEDCLCIYKDDLKRLGLRDAGRPPLAV